MSSSSPPLSQERSHLDTYPLNALSEREEKQSQPDTEKNGKDADRMNDDRDINDSDSIDDSANESITITTPLSEPAKASYTTASSSPQSQYSFNVTPKSPTLPVTASEPASEPATSLGFFPWIASLFISIAQSTRSWWASVEGDRMNMVVLLLLYCLQGIPMGISLTVPLVMQERGAGYASQAVFSIVTLPFSLKLLWAPLVDSYYFKRIGRRKSWMIPTQIMCGLCLLILGPFVDKWIGRETISADVDDFPGYVIPPGSSEATLSVINISALSAFFVFLYFLMATQDIAVDAWALTLLQRKNVGYAGTINNIGQYLGIYLAHIGYLILSSAETSNKYFRSEPKPYGIVNISSFMQFCGALFLITTIVVGLFVKEYPIHPYDAKRIEARKARQALRQRQMERRTENISQQEYHNSTTVPERVHEMDQDEVEFEDEEALARSPLLITPPVGGDKKSSPILPSNLRVRTVSGGSSSTKSNDGNSPRVSLHPHHHSPEFMGSEIEMDTMGTVGLASSQLITSNPTEICQAECIKEDQDIGLEESDEDEDLVEPEESFTLKETFRRIYAVLKLPSVQLMCLYLLTSKLGTAPSDHVTQLKLFERGLKKTDVALLASLSSPVSILAPVVFTSIANGPNAFKYSILSTPVRIFYGFFWAGFVLLFPSLSHHFSFFVWLFILSIIQSLLAVFQSVTLMAFFAKIADPKIGGTFITLLNTASNLGGSTTKMLAMYFVDVFTASTCLLPPPGFTPANATEGVTPHLSADEIATILRNAPRAPFVLSIIQASGNVARKVAAALGFDWVVKDAISFDGVPWTSTNALLQCKVKASRDAEICASLGGRCVTSVDGYYIELLLFSIIGLIWLAFIYRKIKHMDKLPTSAWRSDV